MRDDNQGAKPDIQPEPKGLPLNGRGGAWAEVVATGGGCTRGSARRAGARSTSARQPDAGLMWRTASVGDH